MPDSQQEKTLAVFIGRKTLKCQECKAYRPNKLTAGGLGGCKKKKMRQYYSEEVEAWVSMPIIVSGGKTYIHNHGLATWPNNEACPWGEFNERSERPYNA